MLFSARSITSAPTRPARVANPLERGVSAHGSRGVYALQADLAADALERELARGGAFQQDHRELPTKRRPAHRAGGRSAGAARPHGVGRGRRSGAAACQTGPTAHLIATLDYQRGAARGAADAGARAQVAVSAGQSCDAPSPLARGVARAAARSRRSPVRRAPPGGGSGRPGPALPSRRSWRHVHASPSGWSSSTRRPAACRTQRVAHREAGRPGARRSASRIGKLVGQERVDPAVGVASESCAPRVAPGCVRTPGLASERWPPRNPHPVSPSPGQTAPSPCTT